jgi:transcriptional regulator with XRE-family HTH domain
VDVGKRLRQVRESKNISIYRLSKDSDVSESHIRNLERGTKNATVETLEMLVGSMNMTMAEFFNIDDNIAYLTQDEKILLKYYRTLPKSTSKAIIEFCEKLYNS